MADEIKVSKGDIRIMTNHIQKLNNKREFIAERDGEDAVPVVKTDAQIIKLIKDLKTEYPVADNWKKHVYEVKE